MGLATSGGNQPALAGDPMSREQTQHPQSPPIAELTGGGAMPGWSPESVGGLVRKGDGSVTVTESRPGSVDGNAGAESQGTFVYGH